MRHFDTFSGYGGFTIPARELGWETIGFSEIDKYASAVLEHNFRGVKNYGDISKIDFRQFNGEVDIITGGTPCQDLSVAGKGEGLDGARSGLFFEFIRAITECNPRYFLWENVKGSLSSSKGWDMARVQIEMAEAGYAIEWRVLNATEFSIPQSRERIFILGTRGEGGREILPKPEGTGQALKGAGAYLEPSSNGNAHAIDSNYWKGTNTLDKSRRSQVIEPRAVATRWERTEHGKQVRRESQRNGKDYTPLNGPARKLVPKPGEPVGTISTAGVTKASLLAEGVAVRVQGDVDKRKVYTSDINQTLSANPTSDNISRVAVREATKKGYDIATEGDSINFSVPSSKTRRGRVGRGVANTLDTASNQATLDGYRIRRLTPTECERLMGLPDGWTSKGIINGEEVEISDTQRYKMCGNGVVVDVVRAIYKQFDH